MRAYHNPHRRDAPVGVRWVVMILWNGSRYSLTVRATSEASARFTACRELAQDLHVPTGIPVSAVQSSTYFPEVN